MSYLDYQQLCCKIDKILHILSVLSADMMQVISKGDNNKNKNNNNNNNNNNNINNNTNHNHNNKMMKT